MIRLYRNERPANRWAQWQARMEENFQKAEEYEKTSELNAKEKARVWVSFLSSYDADNPYSTEDNALKKTAQERRNYWINIKTSLGKKPSSDSQSAAKPQHRGKRVIPLPSF